MTKRSHAIYIASEEWELRKQRYYETHARECARCGPPGDDIYALGFDTTPIPAHLVGTRRAKPKKKIATRANGPKKSPAAQRASRVKRTEEEERYMKQGAHQRSLGSSVY